ncbi:aspartic proteinase CDR1-like [Coffea eugenioides]|uniref:aspartic proteinase CDR1-like n=1 Tax=Coffea eugenioides TaxID=49369 RepID=UPI000F60BB73|nr:aspartic proteinase CDR1-like [Coffea eugenioides]
MSKRFILLCPSPTYLPLFLASFYMFLTIQADRNGLILDLIHRDSPESPLHNPSLTPFQPAKYAVQRSFDRALTLDSSGVLPNGGEYLMRISYGTPPEETLAVVDTGSVLSWVQCSPCINCYKEKFRPFSPKKSSTFRVVPCSSDTCHLYYANNNTCGANSIKPSMPCPYGIVYNDRSYTRGVLAFDTISLGDSNKIRSFQRFGFGCGYENVGTTFPYLGSGLVGLGYGEFSLISQLYPTFSGKFSYCLGLSFDTSAKPGKISFGNDQSITYSKGVVSTPFFTELGSPYYMIDLQGISVANTTLKFPNYLSSMPQVQGNIIIDSGTTITFLPLDLYVGLRSAVGGAMGNKTVPDPFSNFELCYASVNETKVPAVTFHFQGADLKLEPVNLFYRTSNTSVCLAFLPSNSVAILGNVAHMNVKVGYDLVKKIISFMPKDCSHK